MGLFVACKLQLYCMPLKTNHCGRLYYTHVGLKQALPLVAAKQANWNYIGWPVSSVAILMLHCVADAWPCQPSLVQISFMVDQLFLPSRGLCRGAPTRADIVEGIRGEWSCRWKSVAILPTKGKSARSSRCMPTENRDICLCFSSSSDSQLIAGMYPTWEHAQVALASGQSCLFVSFRCILTLQ